MAGEAVFTSEELFVKKLKELGIGKVACAEIDEKRALQTGENVLEVLPVKRVDLLAYRGSTIYKCVLENADHRSLYDRLESLGFEIKVRSRNIT